MACAGMAASAGAVKHVEQPEVTVGTAGKYCHTTASRTDKYHEVNVGETGEDKGRTKPRRPFPLSITPAFHPLACIEHSLAMYRYMGE
jgi:hypothetical protein